MHWSVIYQVKPYQNGSKSRNLYLTQSILSHTLLELFYGRDEAMATP